VEAESLYKTNTVIKVNPIENMWSGVKRTMQETWPILPPRNSDELWDLVSDAWDEVASSQRYIRSLIGSMTRRMKSVVEAEGFCTVPPALTYKNSVFCPQSIYCVLRGSQQTAIISLYSINLSVFITEAESVYCAVRTGSLNQTAAFSSSKVKGAVGSTDCSVIGW
jgi:hypothetical protein